MFTVKDFLELPDFQEFELIAGKEGIENAISSVNIMDNPDALDWFAPGELLLTSGYFFKDSQEIQNQVVTQLKDLNCPALCIKPRQYLGNIPQNIILLADELNLPVIKLPYGKSFSQIADIIREEISVNFNKINRVSLDVHKAFFDISLSGGGISTISKSLAQMISNPVIFMDKYFNVIDFYDLEDNPYTINDVLNKKLDYSILNKNYINSLPSKFEQYQKPLARKLYLDDFEINTVITSVYIQNIHYGYILVWQTMNDLSNMDYITLEHSTMSFALERIRTNEMNRMKNRVRRDFLHDLFLGNITDHEELKFLCDTHRINMSLSYTPMILTVDFKEFNGDDFIEKKKYEDTKTLEILRFLDHLETNPNYILHNLSIHDQIVVLIGFDNTKKEETIESTNQFATEIILSLEKEFKDIKIYAGIGEISDQLINLNHYYNQAVEALRLAQKNTNGKNIRHFNDFVVLHLLENNIDEIELRKFFNHALEKLNDYDVKNKTDFLFTLETWIESNYNISKTARNLFTHRNTVLYRLEKIAALLNSNLEDPDELLKIHIALKIYRTLDF